MFILIEVLRNFYRGEVSSLFAATRFISSGVRDSTDFCSCQVHVILIADDQKLIYREMEMRLMVVTCSCSPGNQRRDGCSCTEVWSKVPSSSEIRYG